RKQSQASRLGNRAGGRCGQIELCVEQNRAIVGTVTKKAVPYIRQREMESGRAGAQRTEKAAVRECQRHPVDIPGLVEVRRATGLGQQRRIDCGGVVKAIDGEGSNGTPRRGGADVRVENLQLESSAENRRSRRNKI